MFAKLRALTLGALAAGGALATATPADAAQALRWAYEPINTQTECLGLLQAAANSVGLVNQRIQANELAGGAGGQAADGSALV